MKPEQATELIKTLLGAYDKQVQRSTIQAYMVYILHYDHHIARRVFLEIPLTEEWFPKISTLCQRLKNAVAAEEAVKPTREAVKQLRQDHSDDDIIACKLPEGVPQGTRMLAEQTIIREFTGKKTDLEQLEENTTKLGDMLKQAQQGMLEKPAT